ncbi:MAG: hemerythrin family protein [Sulfuricella sp.]|nr:hemerythrin family protein [Sulfuricella sp.]
MGYVDWSEKYTVHDPVMDGHHQEIFRIINDLHSAALARHGKDMLGLTLAKLIEYIQSHFTAEETVMRSHAYPGYPAHKAAHEKLMRKVHEFDHAFRHSTEVAAPEVFAFLVKEWLFNHILGMDMDYAPYLARRHALAKDTLVFSV